MQLVSSAWRWLVLLLAATVGYFLTASLAGLVLTGIDAANGPERFSNLFRSVVSVSAGLAGAALAVMRLRRAAPSSDVHGSARFASEREVASDLAGDAGLIVGREANGRRLLRYDGPAHLLTVAPTRSGKGVGAIVPNLLTANRSVLCVDPKGENAKITARARGRFGPVSILDPFGVTGLPSAAYNPLAALDPYSLDLGEDAAVLADALVYDPPGQVGEAHWNEEAKALVAGVILHAVTDGDPAGRTLARVRELLTGAPDAFRALLAAMQANPAANGLVTRAANRHLGKSDREAAGVLSSAQRHTHFLDSPRMAAVMGRSDFAFADLKAGVATVFLVLPPDRLVVHARWLRLLVAQAVTDMARSPARPASPVLFLLDEFAALGRLEPVERAMGLMAGYGMQLWPILQDLHQLRSTYGDRHGTFLSNAGLVQIFNVNDVDTATWVSRSLGAMTEVFETTSTSVSRPPGHVFATHGSGTSVQLARRDLMTPDEVMRLDPGTELLLRQNEAPVVARKVRYYAEREFAGLHDAA